MNKNKLDLGDYLVHNRSGKIYKVIKVGGNIKIDKKFSNIDLLNNAWRIAQIDAGFGLDCSLETLVRDYSKLDQQTAKTLYDN